MHGYVFPLLAAFACSICNGLAAVLQKISADKEKQADDLSASLLLHLFQDMPYIIGIVLDLLGWILTVYAVQYLPLFLVEAIIAANIVITLFIEQLFLKRRATRRMYVAAGIILAGLFALAFSASPEKADQVSLTVRWFLILSPFVIGTLGAIVAKAKGQTATVLLAGLSGLAFGMTSVFGRIISFAPPIWHVLYNPLLLGLTVSGILGIWLFSTALQRARASVINASMTAAQTLIPSIIGIALLGDEPRNGLWAGIVVGTALVLGGVCVLAFSHDPKSTSRR